MSVRHWRTRRDERGRELPRCAGVSSFGFGGANAHAVIEEYPSSRDEAEGQDGQCVIPLSARNNDRLVEQASGAIGVGLVLAGLPVYALWSRPLTQRGK